MKVPEYLLREAIIEALLSTRNSLLIDSQSVLSDDDYNEELDYSKKAGVYNEIEEVDESEEVAKNLSWTASGINVLIESISSGEMPVEDVLGILNEIELERVMCNCKMWERGFVRNDGMDIIIDEKNQPAEFD